MRTFPRQITSHGVLSVVAARTHCTATIYDIEAGIVSHFGAHRDTSSNAHHDQGLFASTRHNSQVPLPHPKTLETVELTLA
jgi:hypothetical protein